MDIGLIFAYIILFFAGVFAAGTLAYVVLYCAVRGGIAAFIRSMLESKEEPNSKNNRKKGE